MELVNGEIPNPAVHIKEAGIYTIESKKLTSKYNE